MPMDYPVYAYLQTCQDEEARHVVDVSSLRIQGSISRCSKLLMR